MSLATRVASLRALLGRIEREFSPAAFASSFGAEDMVLTDLIAREFRDIEIFTLDTLRLPGETLALIEVARKKYGLCLVTYTPEPAVAAAFVARNGLFSMYESVESRKTCCHIRKVEPLNRALALKKSWLTGLRREQAPSRLELGESEFDVAHRCTKFNPLVDWTETEVWQYIRANEVPYNALHDRGYPSIGCEPCTRAVRPGDDPRAGRWWWEQEAGQKECGLHVQVVEIGKLKSRTGTGVAI